MGLRAAVQGRQQMLGLLGLEVGVWVGNTASLAAEAGNRTGLAGNGGKGHFRGCWRAS